MWMRGLTFVVYGLLVATNEGEFWPFSIYPMFSQGGNSWSRTIVQEVDFVPARWDTLTTSSLPGRAFPLLDHGIDPIDLANFVSKTTVWDEPRAAALQRMFAPELDDQRRLLIFRVTGRLVESDSIAISFIPYAVVSAEGAMLNPALPRSGRRS